MAITISSKKIGLFSATALGISSIMGSGWLFAPYKASVVAGPADIVSWVIGGFLLCLLGLCFSEIATLYPRRGLSAIIPVLSHNKFFAFPFAIANWLGIVAVIGLEADATIQYLINLVPHIAPFLYQNNQLTLWGDMLSIVLVLGFSLVNYWGVNTLVKTNNIFAVIKVIIPIAVTIAMIVTVFHPHNFTHHFGSSEHISFIPYVGDISFIPYGYQSIFTALLTSGIIVAFNGFQTVISFSNEVKNPNRVIPLSVVMCILVCLAIYTGLQIAFIASVPPHLLKNGWDHLQFSAPIVQILSLMGLGMMSSIIYLGATLSPSGTAIAYTGSACRMFTAMSRNEQMPKFFDDLHPIYRISRRSLVLNTFLAVIFLLLFRSWGDLAQVLSIFHVISYLPIPIALWVFRERIERESYPFRVPCGKIISLFIFVFFTYLFTLAELRIALEVMLFFAFFMAIFVMINTTSLKSFLSILIQIWPMVLYFLSILGLIILSPNHSHLLTEGEHLLVTIGISLILFICLVTAKKDEQSLNDSPVSLFAQTSTD